jgi:O-antigen/teichoic acid export membrane protein
MVAYFTAVLRADHRIDLIVKSKYIVILTNLFILIPLCWTFSIYGLIIGYVIIAWMPLIFIFIKCEYKYSLKIDIRNTILTAKIGVPITLVGFFHITMLNMDKLLVVKYMSYVEIGYYKLATTLCGFLLLISSSIAYVLSPYMLERYGKKHDPRELASLVISPSLLIAYIISFIIGILYLTLSAAINILLPRFNPAVEPAGFLLISYFCLAIVMLSGTFLVNIKKSKYVLIAQLLIILSIVIFGPYALQRWGLIGMSLLLAINFFIYSILIYYFSLRAMEKKKGYFFSLCHLYSPLLYTICIFVIFYEWKNLESEITIHLLFQCFIFVVLFVPWFAFSYIKNIQLQEILKGIFKYGHVKG